MAARSLGLAATFGLAANAFLLPPAVSTDDIKVDLDLSTWIVVDPNSQPLFVPCQGCEIDESGRKDLLINIATGSQPGTLELGGTQFYPPPTSMLHDLSEPNALVVPVDESRVEIVSQQDKYTTVPISGWSFTTNKDKAVETEEGEQLLEFIVHITDVNRSPVSVPDIRVNVLMDPKMESLTILSTGLSQDAVEAPEVGHEDQPACETALCQWRQFIGDKIHGISAAAHNKFGSGRPCPGKMMGMMKDGKPHGPFTNMHHGPGSFHHRPIGETGRPHHPEGADWDEHRPLGEPGRPHHHHGHPSFHHGPHHPHHSLHHFMHRVGRFILAVATPILIGIAAGVLAYTVGMVFGCAIALIWIKLFRGGKKGYASVAQAEHEAAAKDLETETEPRASYESAPPVYEDAPAYEEKQVV